MFLGIDPGASGALALLRRDATQCRVEHCFDMPTHEIRVGKKLRRRIDMYQLGAWVDLHAADIELAVIEDVHSMPGMGAPAVFAFGFAAGAAQMVVAANHIPMVLVSPNVWKKRYGLTSDKDASRQLASQMIPHSAHWWARKKDDGRAEAALLAWYGMNDVPAQRKLAA